MSFSQYLLSAVVGSKTFTLATLRSSSGTFAGNFV